MKHIKQIDRPFHVMRTMPNGERLFSAEATLGRATERLDTLPKKQLPARILFRRGGAWETVQERGA